MYLLHGSLGETVDSSVSFTKTGHPVVVLVTGDLDGPSDEYSPFGQ